MSTNTYEVYRLDNDLACVRGNDENRCGGVLFSHWTTLSRYRWHQETGHLVRGSVVFKHFSRIHSRCSGDSYSDVDYRIRDCPPPTQDEPLGIPFPGHTWTEDEETGQSTYGTSNLPNWVGHLIVKRKEEGHPLIAYDYAVGGNTLTGVEVQVEQWFLPNVGANPDWARWDEKDTLFGAIARYVRGQRFLTFLAHSVTWIGINDCALVFVPLTRTRRSQLHLGTLRRIGTTWSSISNYKNNFTGREPETSSLSTYRPFIRVQPVSQ